MWGAPGGRRWLGLRALGFCSAQDFSIMRSSPTSGLRVPPESACPPAPQMLSNKYINKTLRKKEYNMCIISVLLKVSPNQKERLREVSLCLNPFIPHHAHLL